MICEIQLILYLYRTIDESNEWLRGRLDGESDEDEELMFEYDTSTLGVVARVSAVGKSRK